MNKKNLFLSITAFLFIAGGIIFWQLSSQNSSYLPTSQNDNFGTCGPSSCKKPSKAEKNLVEVFYLPHPPVDPIREKIKSILQKFPKYKLEEYDFYNDNSKQKIQDYSLTGHIPVAIFINGSDAFSINGKKIIFKNFPKGNAFVPTLEGSWSYDDLEKVLSSPNKYRNG